MLQVARLAPRSLGEEATARVADFVAAAFDDAGGAVDRAGGVDLYYTVFALDGLVALRRDLPSAATARWLERFGAGDGLDLVHLACLARCWAAIDAAPDAGVRDGLTTALLRHRSADGGFAAEPGAERGGVYEAFLAHGAFEDLGVPLPDAERLARSVLDARCIDGGFARHPAAPEGVTTVTAAAVVLLRALGTSAPDGVADWLLARLHPQGGFQAAPRTPIPDLLSTATALHALACCGVDPGRWREPCLDFVDTLWTGRAFCGSWQDDVADVEYTFYALLALGHLAA